MSLAEGARLGSYEIVALIGAGGMGEVYRARDTKLKREVAVKVLPATFLGDADRLSRFQREAELLATLNHPNIAAVYGLEDADGASGIILELVEGPTLAEQIGSAGSQNLALPEVSGSSAASPAKTVLGRGRPIPLDEALPIARQIIDALEAAHDKGIVHRDLKPANIKIAPDGTVKVLDFGLAKIAESQGTASSLSLSPTLSIQATYAGVILGTAAYMSPEQARGKPVDRRTDVWAFGCVLFEMLSGKQVFESAGDTVSDAVAAVLMKEPDWNALPADTPVHIQRLLRRCLEKDLKKRLPHIAIARFEIDEPSALAVAAPPPPATERAVWRRALPVLLGVTLASLVTSAIWWTQRPSSAGQPITRFPFMLPEDQRFTNVGRQLLAISPDGTRMVYVANARLYLRSMAEHEPRPIAGTEIGAAVTGVGITSPAFSPDGQSLAFWAMADGTLKRIALNGGAAVTICEATNPFGLNWGTDGIVFGQGARGIMRVSANGGMPELLVGVKEGEVAHGPQMLPGGQAVLFTLANGSTADRWDTAKIVVHSLRTGEQKTLIEGGGDARYLPTGHIVYARSGVLFAVAFDADRLEVSPGPVPVVEGVRRGNPTGAAQFSVSNTGSLIYIPGPATTAATEQVLALVDSKGVVEPLKVRPAPYEFPRLSTDGSRVAVGTDDGKDANVWIYELSGTTAARQLTFGGRNKFPVWTADGRRVAFQSDREGDLAIFWQLADGTETAERLTKPEKEIAHVPESWSPDGKILSFDVITGSQHALWTLALADKKTAAFGDVRSSGFFSASTFSPNGRWLAYTSNEGTAVSVFVQPFPSTGSKYLISRGGIHPIWSPDGNELFFISQGQFNVVNVVTRPSFAVGNTRTLRSAAPTRLRGPSFPRDSDILRDGNRVIGITTPDATQSALASLSINVVLNWFEELRQRVPTR